MVPPSDFQLKTNEDLPITWGKWVAYRPDRRLSATMAELKNDTLWAPNRTFVTVNGKKYLREAILLQCADSKSVILQLEREAPDVYYLAHLKYKAVVRDTINQGTILKFHDRGGRSLTVTVTDFLMGFNLFENSASLLEADDCYVFEISGDDPVPRFIYNTTRALRLGKPSWLA
jgi:hypothetical protein